MPYFKDTAGKLHFLDSSDYAHLLPIGSVPISDAEADAIQNHPLTLAQAQAAAFPAIDDTAGAARARYITVAAGQEATYLLKESQARAYKAAGYPSASVASYPMVEAEAKAINGAEPTAAQIQTAADGIIAQADAWIAKAAQIEQARIGGKRAVSNATSVADADAARAAAVAELAAL